MKKRRSTTFASLRSSARYFQLQVHGGEGETKTIYKIGQIDRKRLVAMHNGFGAAACVQVLNLHSSTNLIFLHSYSKLANIQFQLVNIYYITLHC